MHLTFFIVVFSIRGTEFFYLPCCCCYYVVVLVVVSIVPCCCQFFASTPLCFVRVVIFSASILCEIFPPDLTFFR